MLYDFLKYNKKGLIENTILREELNMEVAVCTASPEEVIRYVQENQTTDIYFLDVDLKKNINGIRLGETIVMMFVQELWIKYI